MVVLSIIIPCYNEEKRLSGTLLDVAVTLARMGFESEVIVVDDGSSDATSEVALSFTEQLPALRVLRFEENHGKGHAVRCGVLAAKGQYVLFMDADNSTPLSEIDKLWPHTGEFDVVIGSRRAPGSDVVIRQPLHRRVLGRLGNVLIQALAVRGVRDTQCGFKLFSRTAARDIFSRQQTMGFGFDIEVLAIAARVLGYRIKEVPVAWYDAPESKVRPLRDGWRTMRELLRIRMNLMFGRYAQPLRWVVQR